MCAGRHMTIASCNVLSTRRFKRGRYCKISIIFRRFSLTEISCHPWEVECHADDKFAATHRTRRSITVFIGRLHYSLSLDTEIKFRNLTSCRKNINLNIVILSTRVVNNMSALLPATRLILLYLSQYGLHCIPYALCNSTIRSFSHAVFIFPSWSNHALWKYKWIFSTHRSLFRIYIDEHLYIICIRISDALLATFSN